MKDIIPQLLNCPLFTGLDEHEIRLLLDSSSARLRSFEKGDLVAMAGDEVHFQHIMISGSVEFMGVPGAIALAMTGVLVITGLFLVIYRGWLQSTLLSTPLLGAGLRWINLAGVARWLAAMLRNNAPPGESLRIATSHSQSSAIRKDGRQLAAMIRDGKVLSHATKSLNGLPLSLLVGLAKEPTDSRRRDAVASTLDSLAGMFDRAVFSSGRIVAAVLQVLLLTIVSGVIGLTVLALFLPLIQLLNDFGIF